MAKKVYVDVEALQAVLRKGSTQIEEVLST